MAGNVQQPPESVKLKKPRAFKLKTSDSCSGCRLIFLKKTPVVVVLALQQEKPEGTQEPTQREITHQIELEDNVSLESSSRISLGLYVDLPGGKPLSFDKMKVICNLHILNGWTAKMLHTFREGEVSRDLQLSDLKKSPG